MRAEESPARLTGLGSGRTYKHITWGAKKHKEVIKPTCSYLLSFCLELVWLLCRGASETAPAGQRQRAS